MISHDISSDRQRMDDGTFRSKRINIAHNVSQYQLIGCCLPLHNTQVAMAGSRIALRRFSRLNPTASLPSRSASCFGVECGWLHLHGRPAALQPSRGCFRQQRPRSEPRTFPAPRDLISWTKIGPWRKRDCRNTSPSISIQPTWAKC